MLAVAVYEMKNPATKQEVRVVRYLLPLGLLLQPGIRFTVDGQQGTAGNFAVCFPNGCFAEAGGVDAGVVAAMKKGTTLNVSVQNQTQREVTFAVPLAGFGKAFDGPAMDPKVLEEQQKKLQAELEKRSEDMRKKLEQPGAARRHGSGGRRRGSGRELKPFRIGPPRAGRLQGPGREVRPRAFAAPVGSPSAPDRQHEQHARILIRQVIPGLRQCVASPACLRQQAARQALRDAASRFEEVDAVHTGASPGAIRTSRRGGNLCGPWTFAAPRHCPSRS